MSDLALEPYAVQQRWRMPQPLDPGEWTALFGEYLHVLAGRCAAAGPCIIGHIKLLARFTGQDYLRVSVVSATHPPTLTGAVPGRPAEVAVTLNVLVYGLPRATLAVLASSVAAAVAEQWAGAVDEHALAVDAHHAH